MFTETAVLASVAPICSAIDMNRLLKTSSSKGETCPGSADGRTGGEVLRSSSSPPVRASARQPGSTTVVLVSSQTIAGPSTQAARREVLAREHRRLVPAAAGEDACHLAGLGRSASGRQPHAVPPPAGPATGSPSA